MIINTDNFELCDDFIINDNVNLYNMQIPLNQIPIIKSDEFTVFKMLTIGSIILIIKNDYRNNLNYCCLLEQELSSNIKIKDVKISLEIDDNNPLKGLIFYNKKYFQEVLFTQIFKDLEDLSYFKIYNSLIESIKDFINNKEENTVKELKPHIIHYNGKTYNTLRELTEEYGVKYKTVHARITKQHLTIEEAMNKPFNKKTENKRSYKNRIYTYAGQKVNIKDIVELTGINEDTIRSRIKAGWDIEKIIETPKLG